ncbi:MAG: hypothetical protein Fur0037_19400 [Planctomycetota bacterium]
MSRWVREAPWRVRLDAGRRRLVEELRRSRPGPRWSRPLGVLLLAVAAIAAIAGDYRLPMGAHASATSTTPPLDLRPRPIRPLGEIGSEPVLFEWEDRAPADPAPAYDLVLLDEDLREIARSREIRGRSFAATGAIAKALRERGSLFWCVERLGPSGAIRSPLAAVVFSGPGAPHATAPK